MTRRALLGHTRPRRPSCRTPYAASELLGRITLYIGFILCNACGERVEIVWSFITSRTGSIAVVPTMHASVAERACAAPVTRLLGDGGKGCRPLRRAGGNPVDASVCDELQISSATSLTRSAPA
jgi:hypothetical protein